MSLVKILQEFLPVDICNYIMYDYCTQSLDDNKLKFVKVIHQFWILILYYKTNADHTINLRTFLLSQKYLFCYKNNKCHCILCRINSINEFTIKCKNDFYNVKYRKSYEPEFSKTIKAIKYSIYTALQNTNETKLLH